MGGVVGIAVQRRQQDAAAAIGRGVDKLVVAHIDTAVGGGAGGIVVVVKEDQVPGLQLVFANRCSTEYGVGSYG